MSEDKGAEKREQTHPGTEDADVKVVDQAVGVMRQGNLAVAERLLQGVIAHTPADYVNSYVIDEQLFVKCWDEDEFIHLVMRQQERGEKRDVVWKGNAYPRAYYYLGFIEVEHGRPQEAIRWLDAGQRLEPGQAHFRLEKGKVLSSLRDFQGALALYSEALAMGDEVPARTRAAALRGKGFQYIELNRLDEAEDCFLDSLMLDPDSEVASNELGYITHLRKGGSVAPQNTVKTGGQNAMACASCGKTMQEGNVGMAGGKVTYLCKACKDKAERKPWQFWKS